MDKWYGVDCQYIIEFDNKKPALHSAEAHATWMSFFKSTQEPSKGLLLKAGHTLINHVQSNWIK